MPWSDDVSPAPASIIKSLFSLVCEMLSLSRLSAFPSLVLVSSLLATFSTHTRNAVTMLIKIIQTNFSVFLGFFRFSQERRMNGGHTEPAPGGLSPSDTVLYWVPVSKLS